MGAPSSIHDSDITAPLPVPNFSVQKAKALDMHVKLSRLIAQVLNSKCSTATGDLMPWFPRDM
jgi:proline utilization trans-activator